MKKFLNIPALKQEIDSYEKHFVGAPLLIGVDGSNDYTTLFGLLKDHITGYSAAEAVKITLVQFHAGVSVIMERTTDHAVSTDLQPIIDRSLRNSDNLFYQLKPCHYCSLPSERKSWVPFFTIEPLFLALPAQSLYNVVVVPKKVI